MIIIYDYNLYTLRIDLLMLKDFGRNAGDS